VLGGEGAGTVVAVGPEVTSVQVGERVASVSLQGSYAGRAIAAAATVVPLPPTVAFEAAAASLLQGMTAHYLLFDTYPVRRGDEVLVHAGAGGMGLLLTQIATRLGARVIATVSTEDKARLARQAGAAEVIIYRPDVDVAAEVRRLTAGAGVAAAYDGVGASTFDASLASLRPRGVLALYGQASGAVPPFDPQRLQAAGSVYLTRPTLQHHIATPGELHRRAKDLFGFLADGLDIRIHDRYPLREARRAHEDLQSRRTTGKLLLIP
jgi:NADPH2:quinone reductase